MKNLWIAIFCLFGSLNSIDAQCKQHNQNRQVRHASYTHGQDIVDRAVGSDQLNTLVVALKAADLITTLKGDGPFTVFAPINTAFAKLPEGTVANLLEPENKKQLQEVLTYHVVAGEFTAKDIITGIQSSGGSFKVKTVQGGILTAKLSGNNVILQDAKGGVVAVTNTDIEATNGVVHLIDGVVLP